MRIISNCAICGSEEHNIVQLWDLPNLPLSETFGVYDSTLNGFDQEVISCKYCGHVQLKYQLPPELLYAKANYHYQTGKSASTPKRFKCFSQWVSSIVDTADKNIIDIGGNDSSLLNLLEAKNKTLVDPSADVNNADPAIKVINELIEECDITAINPGVVLCSHTLEHIADPISYIKSLFKQCSQATTYFFEVPCVLEQVKGYRFDAFFHQHFHYFQPSTINFLISSCGGELIDLRYNDYPTCGGSIMFAFRKLEDREKLEINPEIICNFNDLFEQNLRRFQKLNLEISQWIDTKKEVYGFGASLLLPVIFYHIGVSSNRIIKIMDDDLDKSGWTYRNLKDVQIVNPSAIEFEENDGILITSYENIKVLSNAIRKRFDVDYFKEFI